MTMKRLFIALMALTLTVGSMWGKDDEIIVTRQITIGQRNALPEKTIAIEMKRLAPAKKADAGLIDAITQVMDTIAGEDYQNRTFVMLLEPKESGIVDIAVHSDDIVTRGQKDASIYYGVLDHKRYHFVLLIDKENLPLLEQSFKRHDKVKFVQEFEIVDFPTLLFPTNVITQWAPGKEFKWLTVIINEDPNNDRDAINAPVQFQD